MLTSYDVTHTERIILIMSHLLLDSVSLNHIKIANGKACNEFASSLPQYFIALTLIDSGYSTVSGKVHDKRCWPTCGVGVANSRRDRVEVLPLIMASNQSLFKSVAICVFDL